MRIKRILVFTVCVLSSLSYSARPFYRTAPEHTSHYNYIIARLMLREGNIEEGLAYLEEAARLDPKSKTVKRDLFEIYYIIGEYSRARDTAEEMLELSGPDTGVMESLAGLYFHLGEEEKAVEMYEKILKNDPSNIRIRLELGAYLAENGLHKEAFKHYRKILKIDPCSVYAVTAVGDLYLEMGQYTAAVRVYLRAVECGADKREVNMQIARIYTHVGRKTGAVKYLRENLNKDPDDMQSLYMLAEIYGDMGKTQQADKLYLRLEKLTGDEYTIPVGRGTMFLKADEICKAEEIFKELTASNPDEFYTWYLLGFTRLFKDDYEGAFQALQKAVEIREDADAYFNLGVAAEKMEKKEISYEMFKKSIELDGDHDLALNYLGYLWADRNINLEKAEEYIKRALKINPGKASYIDSIGWVYYRQGEYEKAFAKLKKAAKLERDPEIFEHLGDVYVKLGHPAAALRIYRKTLKMDPGNDRLIGKIKDLTK